MAKDTEKMVNTSNESLKKSVDGASGMRPSKPNPPSTNQGSSSDKK